MTVCLIGLGSNVGERANSLRTAIARLDALADTRVLAVSQWRETAPVGGSSGQSPYLNAAARIETSLAASALWARLVAIENEAGRQRNERWGPRTLDIDLLLFGQARIELPDLVVPHPRMTVRRFVLEPAAEIAGDLVHSTTGWTIAELNHHLCTAARYVAVAGLPDGGKTALVRQIAKRRVATAVFDADAGELSAIRATGSSGPLEHLKLELAAELELSVRRANRLSEAFAAGARDSNRWQVSDFWLPQSLAYVAARAESTESREFQCAWDLLERNVPKPKFTVWLDFEPTASGEPRNERERLNQRLATLLGPPARGPVLRLRPGDNPEPVEQVLAAMAASE